MPEKLPRQALWRVAGRLEHPGIREMCRRTLDQTDK